MCALEGNCMSFLFMTKTKICNMQRRAASLAERLWANYEEAEKGARLYWERKEVPAGARLKAHGLRPKFINEVGGYAFNILTGLPFPSNGTIMRWDLYRQYPSFKAWIEIFR